MTSPAPWEAEEEVQPLTPKRSKAVSEEMEWPSGSKSELKKTKGSSKIPKLELEGDPEEEEIPIPEKKRKKKEIPVAKKAKGEPEVLDNSKPLAKKKKKKTAAVEPENRTEPEQSRSATKPSAEGRKVKVSGKKSSKKKAVPKEDEEKEELLPKKAAVRVLSSAVGSFSSS